MNTDGTSRATLRPVEGIRIIDVQGFPGSAAWIVAGDGIHSFRHELVTLPHLSSGHCGERADCPLPLHRPLVPQLQAMLVFVYHEHRLSACFPAGETECDQESYPQELYVAVHGLGRAGYRVDGCESRASDGPLVRGMADIPHLVAHSQEQAALLQCPTRPRYVAFPWCDAELRRNMADASISSNCQFPRRSISFIFHHIGGFS